MKRIAFPRIKPSSPYFFSFFLLASLILSLTVALQTSQAQQMPLTLADILTGLRSKKVTLADRNKLLTDAVKKRGVTFTLTPELEKELEITGADRELLETIRQKAPVMKAIPTPISAAPTPGAPVYDFAFYQNRANARFVKGEYDLALVDYNKVIELNSKDASVYFNRAMAYYNKKSYGLAIADYDRAIELDPKDSMSYLNRGDSYEKIGNIQEAISDYQKAFELDAENETAKNNLKRLQPEQVKTLPEPTKNLPEPPRTTPEQVKNTSEPKKPEIVAVSEPIAPPQIAELGQLNTLALSLAMPVYPEIARKSGVQGIVYVRVTLSEEGKVISAKATSGSSLLRSASEDAARKSKFKPTLVASQAVKANGFIVYNFVNKP